MNQPRLRGRHSGLLQGPRCAPRPRAWPRPGLRSPATFPGSFPEGGARWSGARVPRRGRPARAEKAGPQPRAARPSPDRGNNCSLGPRLRRCAPRRPGAPRLDGAPSQTFLAPFLVAGQSPVQRWRREVSGPGEHAGERYEESASAAGTQSALRGQRPAAAPSVSAGARRGGCAPCCVAGAQGVSCLLLPWATLAPRGAKNQGILPTGEQTTCSERPLSLPVASLPDQASGPLVISPQTGEMCGPGR